MNVDCQWIEQNLEALFCDQLTSDQERTAHLHLENCDRCRRSVEELKAIDPLVKRVFRQDLAFARTPRPRRSPLLAGAVVTAAVAIVLLLVVRLPQAPTPPAPAPPPQVATAPAPEAPPIPKSPDAVTVPDRAKPEATAPDRPLPPAQPPAASGDKPPDFLVTDLAGYSRTLNDFRGTVLIFGVWSSAQPRTVTNFERIYKAMGANTKLRILGVSDKGEAKPSNATFPMANNQGSTLLGATAGQFFVVDGNGTVRLRGNLLDSPANILESIRNTLEQIR